jgi:hypothetical protein
MHRSRATGELAPHGPSLTGATGAVSTNPLRSATHDHPHPRGCPRTRPRRQRLVRLARRWRHQLEPALVSAWDPHDPNWPAQVESWLEPDDDYDDHPSLSAQDRNPSLR